MPPTLAKLTGKGALQFSMSRYESGGFPRIYLNILRAMLIELAEPHQLGSPQHIYETSQGKMLVSGDFDDGNDVVRVWYVSDGRSVGLITLPSSVSMLALFREHDGERLADVPIVVDDQEAAPLLF